MKKVATLLSVLILCLTMLAGCGSTNVDLSEVMNKINTDFNLSLKTLENVDDLNTYYTIDTADVKQFAAELDANANAPQEIVMVEAVDADAASRVETALSNRYNSIYGIFKSYSPEQASIVEESKVTKDGNFVSMIVAENSADMLKVYYEFVK